MATKCQYYETGGSTGGTPSFLPMKKKSLVMEVLGRMNPLACVGGGGLGGGLSDVVDDENDVGSAAGFAARVGANSPGGGGCISPIRECYVPEDRSYCSWMGGGVGGRGEGEVEEPLETLVPRLLADIAAEPPPDRASRRIDNYSSPLRSGVGSGENREGRRSRRRCRKRRSEALKHLYELTKKEKEWNRVPLVCTTEWDVVDVLSTTLVHLPDDAAYDEDLEDENDDDALTPASRTSCAGNAAVQLRRRVPSIDDDRRTLCWTLNNLSIPYENKAAMLVSDACVPSDYNNERNVVIRGGSGEGVSRSAKLLHALTHVMGSNLPESYLCCICLMNLTFLADAVRPVILYVPPFVLLHGMGGAGREIPGIPVSATMVPSPPRALRACPLHARSRSANGVGLLSSVPGVSRGGGCAASDAHCQLSEECLPVLEDQTSLLRTVEQMMVTNARFLLRKVLSVQGEAVRWACGLIRNVTYGGGQDYGASDPETIAGGGNFDNVESGSGRRGVLPQAAVEEACALVARTEIPRLVVLFVRDSPHPPSFWTRDSVEDISLGIMCNLARWPSSLEALRRAGAVASLGNIEALPGIHGYRARAIRCSLGDLPQKSGQ